MAQLLKAELYKLVHQKMLSRTARLFPAAGKRDDACSEAARICGRLLFRRTVQYAAALFSQHNIMPALCGGGF